VDSLCEHRAGFTLAPASGLVWGSASRGRRFGLHHKHLRSIHLNVQIWLTVQIWNRGTLDLPLLADLNVLSNRFGRSLDRVRRNLYTARSLIWVPALAMSSSPVAGKRPVWNEAPR
jgi:hypothetical protein